MRLSFLVCLASFGWLAGIHGAGASVPAKLPANFRVLDMPDAKRTQDRFVDFQSQYTFDPLSNVVAMTRDGTTHFDSDVCTPDDFAQMRPAIEAIGRDVRAEVIVRSTLVEPSSVASQAP
ncbi:hypothetical protein RI103_18555 [Paraburkholderia sp. FT54]|uniref:hypothetical protein n=1 Tax=Paraburkholderia sp. FT54 TaxID=3074437 RepID=UPI0028775D06|nr:hypothetical protein [Paraburkholderia sp. FT54]WNC89649.1 hypothetical protein RI103_18555 [Paraburkholderia sp. FT54]